MPLFPFYSILAKKSVSGHVAARKKDGFFEKNPLYMYKIVKKENFFQKTIDFFAKMLYNIVVCVVGVSDDRKKGFPIAKTAGMSACKNEAYRTFCQT